MLRSKGGHFPGPALAAGTSVIGSSLSTQKRHGWAPYIYYQRGPAKIGYPGKGKPADTNELRNRQYYPKSRSQWDYVKINENITEQSEFTKMDNRPDFDGPREKGTEEVGAYPYKNPPNHKRLHEYFDEYTQPGSDPKMQAALAVKEHWDAENFYYPGESWQRNRPGFRSVPKEMLNKQTCYHWLDWVTKFEDFQVASRPRTWNPIWPPPGYKVPKLVCKREFVFGVEEPGLVHEIERWYWHRMWFENNVRHGPIEFVLFACLGYALYYVARKNQFFWKMRVMTGNMWYPGRSMCRAFGEPRNAEEGWWWQKPLEDRESFPEPGLVWYINEIRFGYINYCKKEEERKKMEAAVA